MSKKEQDAALREARRLASDLVSKSVPYEPRRGPRPRRRGRVPRSAAKIRALRLALGFTQRTFAALLHTDNHMVSRWENGYATPDRWQRGIIAVLDRARADLSFAHRTGALLQGGLPNALAILLR